MLTYFLQVNLCWLMFYGLYWALLSRETFFKLNRLYLIISLLGGLIVPFATEYISQMEEVVTMPIVQMSQPMVQDFAIFQENIERNMVTTVETLHLWAILSEGLLTERGGYFMGVAWVLTRFLIGLFKIGILYRKGLKEKNNGFTLIHSEDLKTPFSFFKWIFIDKTLYDDAALGQILEHEKAHVRQKHSFDIVGIEILRGAFWLSPLVHLYARSLRNVHEYLADAAVLSHKNALGAITEKKQYGRLLIHQSAKGSGLTIANHFNFSQLKKRIIMMTRNRSERKALVKYAFTIPLFLVLVSFLVEPDNKMITSTETLSDKLISTVEDLGTYHTGAEKGITASENSVDDKPHAQLNTGFSGGSITPEQLINSTHIVFYKKNSDNNRIPYACNNVTFNVERIPIDGSLKEIVYNIGEQFNGKVKDLFKKAKLNDHYMIHYSNVVGTDRVKYELPSNSFFIQTKEDKKTSPSLPSPTLSKYAGGDIPIDEFKNMTELTLKSKEGQVNGEITSFMIMKIPHSGDPSSILVSGSKFSEHTKQFIKAAQVADVYYFMNIAYRNNNNKESINLGTVNFHIK